MWIYLLPFIRSANRTVSEAQAGSFREREKKLQKLRPISLRNSAGYWYHGAFESQYIIGGYFLISCGRTIGTTSGRWSGANCMNARIYRDEWMKYERGRERRRPQVRCGEIARCQRSNGPVKVERPCKRLPWFKAATLCRWNLYRACTAHLVNPLRDNAGAIYVDEN